MSIFYHSNGSLLSHWESITHCIKIVDIRSYSGPYFPAVGLNSDQNNSEYGHFSCSDLLFVSMVTATESKTWLMVITIAQLQ